jgi:LmbE family N-acetylglucosaminyl deacetylase
MRRHRRLQTTTYVSVGNVTTPISRTLPRRLLGVWAHPDDECYLSAGLMARVIDAGGQVRLLCATRGERGTDDPALLATETFAAQRMAELESSLAVLGVTEVEFLGLGDGTCAAADSSEMADRIADEIAEFDPDTVITFGPDGITGHSDHVAVSEWTTIACTPQPSIELLYATMTHDHVARHRELHDALGLFDDFGDGRPRAVGRGALALECALDHTELVRKRRALRAHGSQTDRLAEFMGEDVYVSWWRDESFRHPTAAEVLRSRSRSALVGVGT